DLLDDPVRVDAVDPVVGERGDLDEHVAPAAEPDDRVLLEHRPGALVEAVAGAERVHLDRRAHQDRPVGRPQQPDDNTEREKLYEYNKFREEQKALADLENAT
ncbi:MAG TPA: hypothetical protein PKH51_04180, partial [Candidatus Sumerlaeota bacterium]|nr:hypothetical protein [Candidatus Sumerlaeota bacterium]